MPHIPPKDITETNRNENSGNYILD